MFIEMRCEEKKEEENVSLFVLYFSNYHRLNARILHYLYISCETNTVLPLRTFKNVPYVFFGILGICTFFVRFLTICTFFVRFLTTRTFFIRFFNCNHVNMTRLLRFTIVK